MKRFTSYKKFTSSFPAVLLLLVAFFFILSFANLVDANGQDSAKPKVQDKTHVGFEEKLRFYLDEKTKSVVEELLARELQLLQMVHGIKNEIALRGEGVDEEQLGFRKIFGHADTLISEYTGELDRLMAVYDDLERLQRVAEYGGDVQALDQLEDIRNRVSSALENRKLYKKGIYTPERVGEMIDDYTTELDSLLSIYDQLEWLKVQAVAQKNTKALANIREQKQQLLKVLSQWGSLGPLSEEDYLRYQVEVNRVGEVIKKIDDLAEAQPEGEARQLLNVKRSLLDRLDETIIDLLAKAGYKMPAYPTVSEFVDEWKAERLIDIKARLTQYEIIRQNLIKTATPEQRDRMLSQEVTDALTSYANGYVRTAEYQLQDIIDSYRPYYHNFTAIRYYLGECKYDRGAYDAAREEYLVVVADSTPSTYRADALVRLMQFANSFGVSKEFFNYYDEVVKIDSLATPEVLMYAHYLAANKYFDMSQFPKARDILKKITPDSRYYLPGQLLLGIVYTNLNDYDSAIPVFRELTKEKNYPWTDLDIAYIRNTALLRLGMIYYQRGEYASAIEVFDQVSQGFKDYDEALIGQAWASLKLGQYDATLERTHNLLRNYLASNFTYEALVLSAHCKRLLEQPETALNSYRYVVRARGIMEMKKQFDKERARVLDQVDEFNRLEKEALEKRQAAIYPEINRIRNELNEFLLRIQEKGDTGTQLLHDYYDERTSIIEQLQELDRIEEWALKQGRPDVARHAVQQKARLIKILQTFRADRDVTNTAYLVDFPLAAKEASLQYRKENLSSVYRNLDLERRRIEKDIEQLGQVRQEAMTSGDVSAANLELLEHDLSNLRDRLSQFKMWLAENKPGDPKSNISHWSDLAGFGMSDVIYKQRKNRLEQIDYYATQVKIINNILNSRRQAIEAEMERFQEAIKKLQDKLITRKIQLEQLERKTYFENLYFDTHEREEETWEDQLRLYQGNPQ